jgi:hypothetical protein
MTKATGKTAKDAFSAAVAEARRSYGEGGYTGSIAEKRSFVMISVPKGVEPRAYVNELIEKDDDRICDKWGPAGCIALGKEEFLFFGWASD